MALKDNASLALIPAAYKTSKVYSAIPTDGDGDFTFSRSGTGATRINKAGLVETMGTNVPRLNYDLTNGTPASCPSLLLEPTRTNLLQRSEEFDNVYWSKSNCTITPNQHTSPNGGNNAEKLNTNFNSQLFRVLSQSNGQFAFSLFVKIGNINSFTIAISDNQYGEVSATFNLNTESFTTNAGTAWTFNTASITNYGNGWYRCSVVGTNTLTTTQKVAIIRGTTTGFLYIWGAQLEAGSYPTSLIPTSGSAVTRTSDSNEIASGLGSLFNQTEGTIFLDFEYLFETTTDSSTDALRDLFTIGTATNQSDVIFIDNYRSQFRIFLVQNNVYNSLGDNSEGAAEANTRYKLAFRYKSGDSKSYLNGSLLGTNSANIDFNGTLQGIFFSENNSGRSLKNQKKVYQLMVFNEALTDQELITLTT